MRSLLLLALAILPAVALVPAASAADTCLAEACVTLRSYHPPFSYDWCVEYGVGYDRIGHSGVACSRDYLCPSHWVCWGRLPNIDIDDFP